MNPIFRKKSTLRFYAALALTLAVGPALLAGEALAQNYYQPTYSQSYPTYGGGYQQQPGYIQPTAPSRYQPYPQQGGQYQQPYYPQTYQQQPYSQQGYQSGYPQSGPTYPSYSQAPVNNQPPASSVGNDSNDNSGNIDDYSRYTEQAEKAFNNGQLSQSVELFEKALAVAPESSIPVVYNNLAVVYLRRGNYYHDHQKQDENALNDYRKAFFYLDCAWPEGVERKPLHEQNRKVAREDLNIAYRNLKITPDKAKHAEMAKQLRMQGKFPEAIVEYSLALAADTSQAKDPALTKALGDLFTVVSLPEKSKKYYAMTVGEVATGGTPSKGIVEDDMLVQLGSAQYKTGEIDKAVANYDKALAVNPNNPSALSALEKIWLNEIKFNPSSVLGHANLGSVYQKKKMYDQAMQQYNAAESFAERDPKASFDTKKLIRLNIGSLFQEKHQYELALKAYDTVLQVEPNHLQANYYKATLLEESGNMDGAIQAYNKVLSIDPKYKPAQNKLLSLVKQQTDPSKLAAGLKQYGDRFANDATIQEQIGEEFHQRKDLANAVVYYQRAIQLNPNMANAWGNLGAVYQSQGKDAESAEAFNKAQALDPNNTTFKELASNAASSMGYKAYQDAVALQQQGKAQDAIAQFKKALLTNDTPEVRAAYGISLQSAGQLDDAIAQYKLATAKDANNADYQYYLGTAYHQKKDIANAQVAYKKALSLKPGYTEAQQALDTITQQAASAELDKAIDAYNKKQYPSALTLVNQAIAKNPHDPMAHYYKGLILDAQKKITLAAQSYNEAIKYNPDFGDAYYALGVALDTNKDTTGARNAFEKFIQLSSNSEDDFVKYARDRVKTLSSSQ